VSKVRTRVVTKNVSGEVLNAGDDRRPLYKVFRTMSEFGWVRTADDGRTIVLIDGRGNRLELTDFR
jgi:hypothetical protein